jgi:surface antigen
MLSAAQADTDQQSGDILAFLFDTEPSWISASAILRAIADGLSPDVLTEEDVLRHGATQHAALETLSPGGSAGWRNGRTGHAGDTAVSDAFEMSDGTKCKVFTERIVAGEVPFLRDGIACKAPDKDWEVRTAA